MIPLGTTDGGGGEEVEKKWKLKDAGERAGDEATTSCH